MTDLLEATKRGNVEAVQRLIDAEADVNAADNDGRTPLHLAVWGRTEIARLLIDAGADVNACNRDGETPLLYAALYGNVEVDGILRKHGAKIK